LPCRLSVLHTLTRTGKLKGGSAVLKELDHIEPLFPKGAPRWYSQFDTDAQGLINSAVEGKTSPTQALQQLSSEAKSLASSAG
jgi:multiple sugar transport system substrate-binding protein